MRLPLPLRLLLAAQLKLVTPVLPVVHRVIRRHLLGQVGFKPGEADSGDGHGELKIIAATLEPVIEKILTHLGLQASAPPRVPVRRQALQAA